MKEKDILFESGDYWVAKIKKYYYVFRVGITHSTSIACFEDFSLAERYASYMGSRHLRAGGVMGSRDPHAKEDSRVK